MIRGKWTGHEYHVQRELGEGATGTVYLVTHQGRQLALKVGDDAYAMMSEVNVLKQFQKARGGILGPSLVDVDDWIDDGHVRPFYTMNVIAGSELQTFIRRRGRIWVPVLMVQLLGFLEELHQSGWVFGDLKPDNLRVTNEPPRMAWFDPGGMTKMGRSIKEYTEWYDRGFWGMGSRRAEPRYDLFSVAMICLQLYGLTHIQRSDQTKATLKSQIMSHSALHPYQSVVWQAMNGDFQSAKQMKQALVQAWQKKPTDKRHHNTMKDNASATDPKHQKHNGFVNKLLSFLLFSSFLIFLLALYLVSQVFI
nr:protein kinase family protein [Caldalkalibacillus salinus]